MTRIPHGTSPVELRQAFQRVVAQGDVVTTGTLNYILVAQGVGVAPVWQTILSTVDHGGIGGLSDDDHAQYHTDARGDARYYTETELDAGQLDNQYFQESEFLNTSAGAGDAGKPVKLDAAGHIDASMINDGDVDHGGLAGLGDDDHTQYLLVDGSRNLTGNWSIDPGITIDGRDIRLDGQDLDTLVSNIGKVKVDTGATSDFLGAASGDGVLRTSTGISYADGGNFITLDLDINSLTGEALIVSADTIPFYDATAGANRKVTLAQLSTALVVADEKVKIDAGATAGYIGAAAGDGVLRTGTGLSYVDGGDFVTVALDINSLSVATIVSGDFVPFWDITATATNKKTTFANFEAAVNHDNLLNYAIDNHISHSAVEIQAGSGLGGGGDISLTRTIDLNINVLDVAAIAAGDFIAFWDITATAICKKITFSDFESSLSKVGSQVSVDGAAVADYIGAADSDGVLRVNGALSYVDGGDFVTLGGSLTKCRVRLASVQDVITSTWVKLLLVTEDYDIGGNFASNKFTAPADGYYLVVGALRTNEPMADGDQVSAGIFINGAVATVATGMVPASVAVGVNISDVVFLNATDYVELYVYQDFGSNREIAVQSFYTFMTIHRLS